MVFLDANVLLDYLLPDRLKVEAVRRVLQAIDQPTAISALTAHLVLHFGRADSVPDELLHAAIERSLLLPLFAEDYHWAKQHEAGKDFEDALQVAVALRAGCTQFITSDRSLVKCYAKNHPKLSFIVP